MGNPYALVFYDFDEIITKTKRSLPGIDPFIKQFHKVDKLNGTVLEEK